MTDETKRRTLQVDYLARVEGEGAMFIALRDGQVEDVKLKIYEPPRFFEGLLRGRRLEEAPDITARICGICPVAYQMSSAHAIERALGVKTSADVRALRRLLYCGEWISSHTLHIYMLHAPDFLGYAGAVEMAKDHRAIVERGLKLKKVGNTLMRLVGGREIHPINVRIGGFYRFPTSAELDEMRESLLEARQLAEETVRWTATLPCPEFERDYEFVALSHDDEYPFNEGRVVSSRDGLSVDASEFEQHYEEVHVEHSHALHARRVGSGPYFVGPMARYNLNFARFDDATRALANDVGLELPCLNPFRSIVVRAVEVFWAVNEALRIVDAVDVTTAPSAELDVVGPGVGWAVTEAPRGILYHRYEIDDDGLITDARIVPPTSQNQPTIEEDLAEFAQGWAHLDDEQLTWKCEQAIRNYDPCISCATHFLDLTVERR